MMKRISRICVLLAVIASLGITTPAQAKEKKNDHAQSPSDGSRVWPPPPQKARYKLLQIINGEGDVIEKKRTGLLSRIVADTSAPIYIHFRRPHGVAGDHQGRLYVTDTYLRALFVLDPKERTFKLFAADNPDAKLRQPLAVVVDSQDRVWVADSAAAMVFCFGADEKLLLQFGQDPGDGRQKDPTLQRPAGLAIDERRQRVYVSDAKLNQIFIFDTSGRYVTQFGKPGVGPGEFHDPGALLIDREGQLYVADTLNARVQVFDPEFNLVNTIGSRCDHPGCFGRPKSMALDSDGHLYVTDSWFNNMQIFGHDPRDKDPEKLSVLLFIGEGGQQPGEFQGPGGVYINQLDQVFVADQLNGRIQVIQYLGGDEKKK